jgi:hypothetical protein
VWLVLVVIGHVRGPLLLLLLHLHLRWTFLELYSVGGIILLCHISFHVQLLNSIFSELGSVPLPVQHTIRSDHVVPMILFYPVFHE